MKRLALQFYRFAVVAVVAWLVRDLAVFQRTQGDSPVVVDEVKSFFPEAASLRPDSSARDGLFILDRAGRELGYVVRTFPQAQDIIGYAGATDTLVVLNPDWKIVGLKIHTSDESEDYLKSIATDRRFLKKWNALTWDAAAQLDPEAAGIEGVSGATMTSMAIARGVKLRLHAARDELIAPQPFRIGWRDAGMVAVLLGAAAMAFGPAEWRRRWKLPWQIVLVGYVGLVAGDLLAMKLFGGWTRTGVPWTTAPGLVLLAAAAFAVPWTTGSPLYCHHVCPHGAAQELLGRIRPRRWQLALPAGAVRGLEYLPPALLGFSLVMVLLALPFDLAGLEPFAAYVVRSAGLATAAVAVVGLVASLFVPQAYCRFGCPTGALLNFVRARGAIDRFTRRDGAALALVILAVLLHTQYAPLMRWVKGVG
ncbi:MAG: 4Fe-4S binding protein [Opitutaceae bacterium]|nr:4Fe-4S binding protein [Opitutaceae bacterium]